MSYDDNSSERSISSSDVGKSAEKYGRDLVLTFDISSHERGGGIGSMTING